MKRWHTACLLLWAVMTAPPISQAQTDSNTSDPPWVSMDISMDSVGDEAMTLALARLDAALRSGLNIESEQTAVGLVDMQTGRLAMLRADTQYYAASVPKIAILLSYFQTHPDAADALDDTTRDELGRMIKISSNEMAAKYSKLLGLGTIADVLTSPTYKFYDPMHGGGLWVGKHYGPSDERRGDPLANDSHTATVRQLLRYYLMLEQGRLVSPQASKTMRQVFESPGLEHLQSKFIACLKDRDVQVIRKSGTWREWFADTAVVKGEGRYYILVSLTHAEQGEAYLAALASSIDDWAVNAFQGEAPVTEATPEEKQAGDQG